MRSRINQFVILTFFDSKYCFRKHGFQQFAKVKAENVLFPSNKQPTTIFFDLQQTNSEWCLFFHLSNFNLILLPPFRAPTVLILSRYLYVNDVENTAASAICKIIIFIALQIILEK